jgi:hypothetical protein
MLAVNEVALPAKIVDEMFAFTAPAANTAPLVGKVVEALEVVNVRFPAVTAACANVADEVELVAVSVRFPVVAAACAIVVDEVELAAVSVRFPVVAAACAKVEEEVDTVLLDAA